MRVSEVLRPHLRALHEIIAGGHDDYERFYAVEAKLAHDPSAKAHNVNRHMLDRALKYAAANPKLVHPFESQRLRGIIINQLVAIIFKKLDHELRSKNHVSKQIWNYKCQQEIADIPAALKLIAGYRENDETGEIIGIWVTRPSGNLNRWELLVSEGEAKQIGSLPLFGEQEQDDEDVEITPRKQPGEVIPIKRGEKGDGSDQS